MIDRRAIVTLLGGAAALPRSALAQSTGKALRVAVVNVQPRSAPNWTIFIRRMAELGWPTR